MAQLVARLHGMQKVRGSNPLSSTPGQGPVPISETGLLHVRTAAKYSSSQGADLGQGWAVDVADVHAYAVGKPLAHAVEPRQLLSLPLAFTQDSLLTPDEFAKRARERGVDIRSEYLLELHRQRALVPLLRILQRPPKSSTVVPVAASAAGGYGHFRSPIALALVVAAAAEGLLVDPATTPYRAWNGGLPLPTHVDLLRRPALEQPGNLVGGDPGPDSLPPGDDPVLVASLLAQARWNFVSHAS
jgi:hypothetical protein